jgi:hypothetical protein
VSKFLSIELEWLDQPHAADPVERMTWARIGMNAAGRTISRSWDRVALAERASIFIPAFPIANWMVANWWSILHEPARSDKLSLTGRYVGASERDWIRRHCLRSADAGIAVPRLLIYSDGRGILLEWMADEDDAYPHMPLQFVGSDRVSLPFNEVQRELGEFVQAVTVRLGNTVGDERIARFREDWVAIRESTGDEASFCVAAGRLGLDPYGSGEWQPGLAELIEKELDDVNAPIVVDFLEATDPHNAVSSWKWVDASRRELDLQSAPHSRVSPPFKSSNPTTAGYLLAKEVHDHMNGGTAESIDVARAASSIGVKELTFRPRSDSRNAHLQAAVGWSGGKKPVIAGTPPIRNENRRFLEARSLYHLAFSTTKGPRLVTDARTWDQRASRAFAAELLAPQARLVMDFNRDAWSQDRGEYIQQLANDYRVSTMVIRHQLENSGIDVGES